MALPITRPAANLRRNDHGVQMALRDMSEKPKLPQTATRPVSGISRSQRNHKKAPFPGLSSKPSDGLEPSTPSYHGGSQASREDTPGQSRHSFPANQADLTATDVSRCVARVVSDVSVLCPRPVADFGNGEAS